MDMCARWYSLIVHLATLRVRIIRTTHLTIDTDVGRGHRDNLRPRWQHVIHLLLARACARAPAGERTTMEGKPTAAVRAVFTMAVWTTRRTRNALACIYDARRQRTSTTCPKVSASASPKICGRSANSWYSSCVNCSGCSRRHFFRYHCFLYLHNRK